MNGNSAYKVRVRVRVRLSVRVRVRDRVTASGTVRVNQTVTIMRFPPDARHTVTTGIAQ